MLIPIIQTIILAWQIQKYPTLENTVLEFDTLVQNVRKPITALQ